MQIQILLQRKFHLEIFCDNRQLSAITYQNVYPFSSINSIVDALAEGKTFSEERLAQTI